MRPNKIKVDYDNEIVETMMNPSPTNKFIQSINQFSIHIVEKIAIK